MEGIYAHADLLKVYKAILDATQEIATYLRYHSGKPIEETGSKASLNLCPERSLMLAQK